ncbi:type I restriction enzyme HsdR N-terminal domain-containing protein [Chloroflexota bacterium]
MVEDVAKADGNEAETRRRAERIFESLMGYNALNHISREYAVHGVGNTEHCDFAIQLDNKETSGHAILVELKRVNMNLTPTHLKQAASYAINIGCEWVLLTNSKDWKLYHILFDKPPQTKLIESWNLVTDELTTLAEKFELISYKNIKKNGLAQLWAKSNVLTAQNMLKVMLSEESINLIRRGLRRVTDVTVSPEEIVGAIRHLLNEAAITEMGKIKISLPGTKPRTKKVFQRVVKSRR